MNFQEFKSIYEKKKVEEVNKLTPSKPLVSVCVQTYQHAEYLSTCLESILNQTTDFEYEILLGEDNSKDETRDICLAYSKRFPEKIKLFLHHRENQIKILGEPTSNYNALYNFFSAKGKYIAFCEGDDLWTDPLKLQKQVDFLEANKNYVFSYHSFKTINEQGANTESIEEKYQPTFDISAEDLSKLKYHPLLLCTCFRNVIEDVPQEMVEILNVDSFLYSLLGRYGKAKFLPEIAPANYRKHSGGIWSKRVFQKKLLSKIETFQKLANYYHRSNDTHLYIIFKNKRRDNYKMLVYNMIKSGEWMLAFQTTIKYRKINM